MAEVERRLSAGLNIRLNTMVKKVERQTQGLAVTIFDRATEINKTEYFDQIVRAISPKAIGQSRAIEHLKSPNPYVTEPRYSKRMLNPTAELQWMGDSEGLTVRTRACDDGQIHMPEATHVHPSGALITVWPKHADVDSDWYSSIVSAETTAGKVHEVTFCRVAATENSISSCALEEALELGVEVVADKGVEEIKKSGGMVMMACGSRADGRDRVWRFWRVV
ncbi:MAG: hypothetical protein Q9161_009784 [Pseudevernia consocians]